MENIESKKSKKRKNSQQKQMEEIGEKQGKHFLEIDKKNHDETVLPQSMEAQRSDAKQDKALQEVEQLKPPEAQPKQQLGETKQNPSEAQHYNLPLIQNHTYPQGQHIPSHLPFDRYNSGQPNTYGSQPSYQVPPGLSQLWAQNNLSLPGFRQPQPAFGAVNIQPWYGTLEHRGGTTPYPSVVPPLITPYGPFGCVHPSNYLSNQDYGMPQPKRGASTPHQIQMPPAPQRDVPVSQKETKSVDIKEQNIVREIYNIAKKYLDSDGNNNKMNGEYDSRFQGPSKSLGKPEVEKQSSIWTNTEIKKDHEGQQPREQNNNKDGNNPPRYNEKDEGITPKVVVSENTISNEELMEKLTIIDSENLNLKAQVASLTSTVNSLKSAHEQVKVEINKSVGPRLDALELATVESSSFNVELKTKFETLNAGYIKLIEAAISLEERLDALESMNSESRMAAGRLEAKLNNLEITIAMASTMWPPSGNNLCENSSGFPEVYQSEEGLHNPDSAVINEILQEVGYKGIETEPNADFKEDPAHIFGQVSTPATEEESNCSVGEKQTLTIIEGKLTLDIAEELPTVGEDPTSIEKEKEATTAIEEESTDTFKKTLLTGGAASMSNEDFDLWFATVIKGFNPKKIELETTAEESCNETNRRIYSRESLLELSCHPMSLKKPENLPKKLYRKP